MSRFFIALVAYLNLAAWVSAECITPNTAILDAMTPDQHSALVAEAEAEPFHQGVFWQASRGDQVITLFGTMHVPLSPERQSALLDPVEAQMRQADLVMLEVTEEDETRLLEDLFADPQNFTLPNGEALSDHLSEAERTHLEAAFAERGMPAFVADRFQPWYAALILAMPACVLQEMAAGSEVMDGEIEAMAMEQGLARRSLDRDVAALFGLFMGDSFADQLEGLRFSLAMVDRQKDYFDAMDALYLREDIQLIWALNRFWSHQNWDGEPAIVDEQLAEIEQVLLVERNANWMDEIRNALTNHDSILVAVGAMHLPGEAGLVRRLQGEGFTITRLDLTNAAD